MIRPSRFFKSGALALLALLFALPAQAAYNDNNDGTVTDTVTGLMWDKCSWGQSNNVTCAGGAASTHTWTQALGVAVSANSASYKGHNDWRLPNRNELESLVKIDVSDPAIDATAFPNTVSDWYWTSTNYAPDPTAAWLVYFYDGYPDANGKTFYGYVRLVRSGQSFDSFDAQPDFTPDAFSFIAQTGVALSSVATSNTITVAGINSAANISIVGGTYSINGGCYTSTPGTVSNGDEVTVRQTSSASYNTLTTATLTIGWIEGSFHFVTLNLAVSSIVVDPVAPATLYAGIDGAGVYKSTDGSASWSAASTQPTNTRVKALVIKPGDSAALFAATYGGGVFKSSDSGVNWSACATQPANLNLLSLTMDAAGKLYAGSEAGVFVSSDGCASWAAMNAGLPL
ncbi:MAG: DUF1566 domain-containing protein [Gallionella sp.]|nr:DUF1566 domain-containing protein [Gallionella sp.]